MLPGDLPQAGTLVDKRFRLAKLLGEGGMGSVYQAWDLQARRQVALKLIRAEVASEIELERFQREAELAARVDQSAGVVRTHDFGQHEGLPYCVMELVHGVSLKEAFRGGGPPEEVAATVEALARTLADCHEKGVVHRDLKPANVLRREESGEPVLLDFGLALDVDRRTRLTQTGALLGTPAYMAPEQVDPERAPQDHRVDVYALGGILYYGLTGQAPYRGSLAQILAAVLAKRPPPPRELCPELPLPLEKICLHAMAQDPWDRYPSALELAEDLARWRGRKPILAAPSPWYEREKGRLRRNGSRVAILALGLAVVGVTYAANAVRASWQREQARADLAKSRATAEQKHRARQQESREEVLGRKKALEERLTRMEQELDQHLESWRNSNGSDQGAAGSYVNLEHQLYYLHQGWPKKDDEASEFANMVGALGFDLQAESNPTHFLTQLTQHPAWVLAYVRVPRLEYGPRESWAGVDKSLFTALRDHPLELKLETPHLSVLLLTQARSGYDYETWIDPPPDPYDDLAPRLLLFVLHQIGKDLNTKYLAEPEIPSRLALGDKLRRLGQRCVDLATQTHWPSKYREVSWLLTVPRYRQGVTATLQAVRAFGADMERLQRDYSTHPTEVGDWRDERHALRADGVAHLAAVLTEPSRPPFRLSELEEAFSYVRERWGENDKGETVRESGPAAIADFLSALSEALQAAAQHDPAAAEKIAASRLQDRLQTLGGEVAPDLAELGRRRSGQGKALAKSGDTGERERKFREARQVLQQSLKWLPSAEAALRLRVERELDSVEAALGLEPAEHRRD